MNVSFNGFNENTITMEASSVLKAGDLVTVSAQGVACPCKEGDAICGYAVNVRDGYAAVQVAGFVKVQGASTVTAGLKKLSVDTNGKVAEDAQGREFLVLCADTDGVGFIL